MTAKRKAPARPKKKYKVRSERDPLLSHIKSWLNAADPDEDSIAVPTHLLRLLVKRAERAPAFDHRPPYHWEVKHEMRKIIKATKVRKYEIAATGVRLAEAEKQAIEEAKIKLSANLTPLADSTIRLRMKSVKLEQ